MRVGQSGAECHSALQVDQSGSQVTLLSQYKTKQILRFGITAIFINGLDQQLLGLFQFAPRRGLLSPFKQVGGGTWGRLARLLQ